MQLYFWNYWNFTCIVPFDIKFFATTALGKNEYMIVLPFSAKDGIYRWLFWIESN